LNSHIQHSHSTALDSRMHNSLTHTQSRTHSLHSLTHTHSHATRNTHTHTHTHTHTYTHFPSPYTALLEEFGDTNPISMACLLTEKTVNGEVRVAAWCPRMDLLAMQLAREDQTPSVLRAGSGDSYQRLWQAPSPLHAQRFLLHHAPEAHLRLQREQQQGEEDTESTESAEQASTMQQDASESECSPPASPMFAWPTASPSVRHTHRRRSEFPVVASPSTTAMRVGALSSSATTDGDCAPGVEATKVCSEDALALAWSEDGRLLACGYGDGSVRVLSVEDGAVLGCALPDAGRSPVLHLAWSTASLPSPSRVGIC
jgi:Anaphase-promoting complex subunit 4 WD40 domain